MKKTVITIIRIIVIVAILGLLTYGGFVGMNRVSGTGDYTIDQYAATDDGGLLTVTKGGTALHVKCSADQLAIVETQPDGTFHLSFSYSQITNKGNLLKLRHICRVNSFGIPSSWISGKKCKRVAAIFYNLASHGCVAFR